MNSSYKVVLLGAFALFVAVVAYVTLFNGEPNPEADAQTPAEVAQAPADQTPEAALPPAPREIPSEQPQPTPEPVIEAERVTTIGPAPGDAGNDLALLPNIDDAIDNGDRMGPITSTLDIDTPAASNERIGPTPDDGRVEPSIDEMLLGSESPTGSTEEDEPAPSTDRDAPADSEDAPDGMNAPEILDPEPEAEPTTPANPPRLYKIKEGDTFSSIAEAFYNDKNRWQDIALANPSVDPQRLQIGQEIVLPRPGEVDRDEQEPALPAPNGEQTYTVRPGDTLSRIAQKFYKDSEKWDLIYARNRKLIGAKPNNLKVGMKLVIPQAFE